MSLSDEQKQHVKTQYQKEKEIEQFKQEIKQERERVKKDADSAASQAKFDNLSPASKFWRFCIFFAIVGCGAGLVVGSLFGCDEEASEQMGAVFTFLLWGFAVYLCWFMKDEEEINNEKDEEPNNNENKIKEELRKRIRSDKTEEENRKRQMKEKILKERSK